MTGGSVEVRIAGPPDEAYAEVAEELIRDAASGHDIAIRSLDLLREKIRTERAVLALSGGELVGFGYYSAWEGGKFVSHSGLVVREDFRRQGLARRIKIKLFEASRRHFPRAILMSLTSSPQVKAMNIALGFREVPLDRLTTDPEFWQGCRTCRNYEETRRQGKKCCCDALLLEPEIET